MEERPSFLKKRSKKLLHLESGAAATRAFESKSFLVLFFKKEHLPSSRPISAGRSA